MNIIIFVICSCIFAGWLIYEQRKSQRADEQATEDFWSREARANSTRNKDFSDLPFLRVKESDLPVIPTDDETITYYIGLLRENINQPMIDLSSYSNTDLKLAYGVGNFKTLSDYDENYNTFLLNLTNLARACHRAGLYEPAAETFRLALQFGSRKTADYTWLAETYLKMGQPGQVRTMIAELEAGTHPRKESVIKALREVLAANS